MALARKSADAKESMNSSSLPRLRQGLARLFLASLATVGAVQAAPRPEIVTAGLENPWGVAFLPDGRFLVTERPGRLRVVGAGGQLGTPLAGLPPIAAGGQGGLLDVQADSAFARN